MDFEISERIISSIDTYTFKNNEKPAAIFVSYELYNYLQDDEIHFSCSNEDESGIFCGIPVYIFQGENLEYYFSDYKYYIKSY